MQNRVYLDNASTTAAEPAVLKSYEALLEKYYVNSESLYDEGTEVSRMMEKARGAIAGLLGVKDSEIIFTSGSSESNSSAVKGVCFACRDKRHIVTSAIEHSSIMNSCRQMQEVFGWDVTYLPVTQEGTVRLEDLKRAVRPDTALVSLMAVNNETGAVNPFHEAAHFVKTKTHAYFHCDLTQAVGKIDIDMKDIDLASISAHKIEGLKGSGILVRKNHVPFVPLISGGEQEYGIRGGTSNACVNMIFAKTLRLALENGRKSHDAVLQLAKKLIGSLEGIEGIELNSPHEPLVPMVNFSYEKIPSEVMQNALNKKGFMVSARSTCDSRSRKPSYVLTAMGYSEARANSCIRVSLSRYNTEQEIEAFITALKEIIRQYG
ncbi:MAG: cysteine desulfurase [Solobacterium sp.]|nr:cysteine desulfurase [Solobacterium sp.]